MLTESQRDRVLALSEGAGERTMKTIQSFTEMHSRISKASEFNTELSVTLLELARKCEIAKRVKMGNLLCFMASCAVIKQDRLVAHNMFGHYVMTKVQATAVLQKILGMFKESSGDDGIQSGPEQTKE